MVSADRLTAIARGFQCSSDYSFFVEKSIHVAHFAQRNGLELVILTATQTDSKPLMTDAILPTAAQIRAARALLGWSQTDLAARAGSAYLGGGGQDCVGH